MTLDEVSKGRRARVVSFVGGPGLYRNLSQMGIHPGDTMVVSRAGAFRGPLVVEIHGIRIALGRGVANRIIVDPL